MNLRLDFIKAQEPMCSEIIRTINQYGLIEDGEKVAVAVSGGKDSMVLLYLLWYLNKYSYLNYQVVAMHVKTADYDTAPVADICRQLGIEYFDLKINMERIKSSKSLCYSCSRFKRVAMWEKMEELGITKLALGHHANDAIETFFMNLFEHSKIESIRPKVIYNKYPLVIIRPILTLPEEKIIKIFTSMKLPLIDYVCPHEEKNIRSEFRKKIGQMGELFDSKDMLSRMIKALKQNNPEDCWVNDEIGDRVK